MLIHRMFQELPLRRIAPEGWLRLYLENQSRGLTGNIEVSGYPFNTKGWGTSKFVTDKLQASWGAYEQVAYWVDGAVSCGHLIGDEALVQKATRQIEFALTHAASDGFIGVKALREAGKGKHWPHAVFFRALMAHYSATGDKRVPEALRRHYLAQVVDYSDGREVCNVEAMLWTYERTLDPRMLEMAIAAYEKFNEKSKAEDVSIESMASDKKPTIHGVSFCEMSKIAILIYMFTGKKKYLDAAINGYRKVDSHHMLVDGIPSSSEGFDGNHSLACHETCVITDYTWSVGYLLEATGQAEWADKIERACFNAAPGSVRSHDFTGHQYFSSPNMVLAVENCTSIDWCVKTPRMSYRPAHDTCCCTGGVHRAMPNYAARMWMQNADGSLVATLYGPSRVSIEVGKERRPVTIVEETNYPFSDRIDFQIRTDAPVKFPLMLRIPGWCKNARLMLNEKPLDMALEPGRFITINRKFQPNDRITLILPMELKLAHWPDGGVSIERGPLAYSLKIAENWQHAPNDSRQSEAMRAWNVLPASPWNYALDIDERKSLDSQIEITQRPLEGNPRTIETAPIEFRVPARRVKDWKVCRKKNTTENPYWIPLEDCVQGPFQFTPPLPAPAALPERLANKQETVTLVPYGCTHIRLTVFPNARPAAKKRNSC